jgi:hypothetical protein
VPRKIIGTLTLSNLNSIHISAQPIILYKSYSVVTFGPPKPVLLNNYFCVVALTLDLQAVFFYNITEFLKNSLII